MKISPFDSTGAHRRSSRSGMAIIVVITILSILLIFAMGNARTLDHLGKELRLLEEIQRSHIPAVLPSKVAPE